MCHKLPFPLLPRVFPELVVTAKTGPFSFIVVQIPVNINSLQEAFYSSGRNLKEGDTDVKRKSPVIGYVAVSLNCSFHKYIADLTRCRVYTSVERCRIGEDQSIEWTVAAASNAKGFVPMWTQKLGVPGALVKDVGLLIKWISQRRKSLSADN